MEKRITGTIVTIHADQPEDSSVKAHVGSYGLILGEDGRNYVWSAGQFYRNGSSPKLGARYLFDVTDYGYASKIDRIDKPSFSGQKMPGATGGTLSVSTV